MNHNARLMRTIGMTILLVSAASALSAQQLTVSLSPNSPADSGTQGGTAFTEELAAFTLVATGGAVQVDGITLTVSGTGDFANDLDPVTGLSIWLDDGDGQFNATLDTSLGASGGASPTTTINFTSTLTVPDASSVDLWVVGDFLASAGASVAEIFQVSVANTGDVNVQAPAAVALGAPAPDSATLSVVIFFVTSFSPESSYHKTGFHIDGSGFTPPISVSIGGVDLGVGMVNASHTRAHDWVVPDLGPDDGYHDVVVTTGLLGPITLAQQFHYDSTKPGGCAGWPCGEIDCSTGASGESLALLALLTALVAIFAAPRIASRMSRQAVS